MPEKPSDQPITAAEADLIVRRLREFVSAGIAGIIILGTILMMVLAFSHLSNAEEFARVKDLLLFINPLLGVVIGYYFNKVTSEARAETAEKTAQTAMASAQQAGAERDKAESEAKAAKTEAKETKAALKEVGEAAEKVAAQVPAAGPGVLSVDEKTGQPIMDPRVELQLAWSRAKRLLES